MLAPTKEAFDACIDLFTHDVSVKFLDEIPTHAPILLLGVSEMTTHRQCIQNLREHVHQVNEKVYDEESKYEGGVYESRLNETIQNLQDQIKQHQVRLEELRNNSPLLSVDEPSENRQFRIRQLQILTTAYKSLVVADPVLPSTNSPLPALLALRSTHSLINETKISLSTTKEKMSKICNEINLEEQDLHDHQVFANALEKRIAMLESEQASQDSIAPDELAHGIISNQQKQKTHYAKELRYLMKAFNRFVEEHLASMLAVEELGGPLVGDLSDVDEDTLRAGFNRQGNAKKLQAESSSDEAERQRRIDDLWGPFSEREGPEVKKRTEKEAAGSAFRSLCEDLLNASADETISDPYISISDETAGVRFLVRSKIAQFHPQDATKLRLMDLGRELDD